MEEPGDGGVPCMLSSGHGVPIASPTHSTVLTKSAKIWHRWGRCSPGSPPLRSCWQLTAAGVGEAHACLKVWPMVGLSEWPSPTHMGSTNWIPWAMRLEENGNVFRGQFVYSIRSDSEDDISKLYWFNMHGIFQRILEMVTYSWISIAWKLEAGRSGVWDRQHDTISDEVRLWSQKKQMSKQILSELVKTEEQ